MRETRLAEMDCSVAQTVELVGDKWTLMLVRSMFAFKGLHRFEEFRNELGIAKNILSERLEALVANGIVERRKYSDRPLRSEYHLTAKGQDLLPIVVALLRWGDTYAVGVDGPPVILHHTACDHDTEPYLACSSCHEPITPRSITAQDAPSRVPRGVGNGSSAV